MVRYRQKIYIYIFIVFSLLILAASCKSKKIVTAEVGEIIEAKSKQQLLDDVLKYQLQYKTLETKGSITVALANSPIKSSAVYKVVKDSILQISIRPIAGVEYFRMDITPEGIVIIDRMRKKYVAESFKGNEMLQGIDFNFYNLQALLTNYIFIPGEQEVTEKKYKRFEPQKSNENAHVLQTKGVSGVLYKFSIDASNRLSLTTVSGEKQNFNVRWSYSDFVKDNTDAVYPTNMQADVDVLNRKLKVGISYNKLDINKDLKIDRSVPRGYERMNAQEFIESFMGKR